MYRNHKIGVIVPAYNEEKFIASVIERIPQYVDRVFVIDDASTDATYSAAEKSAAGRESVKVIRHGLNGGVGKTIVTGYKNCLVENIEVAVVMAGDGQMDPAQLPALLNPLVEGNADYTMGNRLSNPAHRKGMSRWRQTGNWVLTWLTRIAAGNIRINDPQNGFTAINCKIFSELDPDSIYPRYGYCNDMLVKLSVIGARIKSVNMPSVYGDEKSKIRYRTYIPALSYLLLKSFLRRIVKNRRARQIKPGLCTGNGQEKV